MDSVIAAPNGLLEKHACKAIVVTCMDFRFWEATLVGFVKMYLGVETDDVLIAPGCTRFLFEKTNPFREYLLAGIALSLELHHPTELILVHHSTCGAYGISDKREESAKQKADLLAARSLFQALFPSLQTRLFFANAQTKEEITYEEIT